MLVVCEPDLETHPLSLALRGLRAEIYREAMACAVPPSELEDILWTALLAVPEGLTGRVLERRLLADAPSPGGLAGHDGPVRSARRGIHESDGRGRHHSQEQETETEKEAEMRRR